ncbi:MAG: EamA family transporter RarD [Opitutaceae bacterium]|nr:EamA family transporter RarD [Opitutaceae bacterium]
MASAPTDPSLRQRGTLAALGGYLLWGAFPLYWKQMEGINALELIAHRIVWSLVFLGAIVLWRRETAALRRALADWRLLGRTLLSGGLLTINWLVYVWAVNHGHVIESSLGYFLVPLFNVALGYLVLGERLRPLQWIAVGGASVGVILLLVGVGRLPWIALSLTSSWGIYGLMRRKTSLGSLDGLALETLLYAPAAAALLLWRWHTGEGALGRVDLPTHLFVLSAGWVTAIPLILFAYGARRIRFTTLGLLQYLTPTIQFLFGLLLYHEAFDAARFRAYALIWCGLLLYSADSLWRQRRPQRLMAAE